MSKFVHRKLIAVTKRKANAEFVSLNVHAGPKSGARGQDKG